MSHRLVVIKPLICLLLFLSYSARGEVNGLEGEIEKQRQQYQQALVYLEEGRLGLYKALLPRLQSYPLYPWLELELLSAGLEELPYVQVDGFLDRYTDTVVAERLLIRWLEVLADQKRWHDYRSYYSETIAIPKLQCLWLWSRLKTGDKTALQEVAPLWDSRRSRANECDPLFDEWISGGMLDKEILWSRFKKIAGERRHSLTRYLLSLANKKDRQWFDLHHKTLRNPRLLKKKGAYPVNAFTSETIKQSLLRLQLDDYGLAQTLFDQYREPFALLGEYEETFKGRQHRITLGETGLDQFLSQFPNDQFSQRTIGNILLAAVKEQNWHQYLNWFERLETDEKKREQWQYWRARALLQKEQSSIEEANRIFGEISKERSYYGFLAAEQLLQDYNFSHRPVPVNSEWMQKVNMTPGFMRARELYFHKNYRAARQEWNRMITDVSKVDYGSLASLVHSWGWHRKSIELLSAIQWWDDLVLRFPLAHNEKIDRAATENNLPSSMIFAIARQESAWQQDALSHANARGLMQIIPSTARATARAAGLGFANEDLFDADKNIHLGGLHLRELLDLYDENRVLSAAAYNAGRHRVKRWLEESEGSLPIDIWIESIPFPETRKYVKNVLFYSALYDYRQNKSITFFTKKELEEKL